MVSMTRQHFEGIARIIHDNMLTNADEPIAKRAIAALARDLAWLFEEYSPLFDEYGFLLAAGLLGGDETEGYI